MQHLFEQASLGFLDTETSWPNFWRVRNHRNPSHGYVFLCRGASFGGATAAAVVNVGGRINDEIRRAPAHWRRRDGRYLAMDALTAAAAAATTDRRRMTSRQRSIHRHKNEQGFDGWMTASGVTDQVRRCAAQSMWAAERKRSRTGRKATWAERSDERVSKTPVISEGWSGTSRSGNGAGAGSAENSVTQCRAGFEAYFFVCVCVCVCVLFFLSDFRLCGQRSFIRYNFLTTVGLISQLR